MSEPTPFHLECGDCLKSQYYPKEQAGLSPEGRQHADELGLVHEIPTSNPKLKLVL